MKKSLIGMQYVPQDNSYEFNLTRSYDNKQRLAGTLFPYKAPTITTITQGPFDMTFINGINGHACTHKFVIVEANKHSYLTMFHEQGIIKESNTIEDCLRKHYKHSESIIY